MSAATRCEGASNYHTLVGSILSRIWRLQNVPYKVAACLYLYTSLRSQAGGYRGFPKPTHFWGVPLIVLNFRYDLVLIRKRLSWKFGIFPLRQFPLCQFPLRQFPFGQLPTSSIPIWSIPIWSMLTKWELTKWESTKWEVDEVGIDKVYKMMLSIWTRCWDVVDCVTDVLTIIHSMHREELIEQLALKVLSI